ncbi:ankyrin repeat-containing domain protein [Trichoderma asperelloides]|nr:ankyrin repeat-containing domain protein [Trichoderma asperelloides]
MVAELLHRDSWIEKSLRIVFTALLHACEGMDLLILIHDYEQWPVEIRSWWTKDLRHLLQSSGTRFTFITSSRSRIENLASQKAHEIDLERNYAKLRRKFVRAKLSSLLDRDYSSIILRQSPQADLRSIIIEKSFPLTTAGAIEGHIEASSGTEERLYNHEISALRVKHVDISFWIASAISWMMLSARSLRLEELAAAAAINADDDTLGDIQEKISMDMAQDLKRHLGPIVAVENNHGCIASAAARAILAATPSKTLDPQDDYKLTRLCLHYLRLVLIEEHQETDIKVELKKPEATLEAMQQHRWGKCLSYVSWKHQSHNHYEPALEFLDYACRFWPTHFLRIKNPDSSLKKEVINFLQASHGQKWFQLYLICHGQSSDTFGKDEEVEKTTVGMLECEPTETGKQPDAENETQPHLASSYETGATGRQLAVRMACYLGLTPIIPELLGSDMLSISFDIVNMHRGSSERIVTIFNNAAPYYLNCAISNDDADLAKKLFELGKPKTAKYYPLHEAALGDSWNTFKILFGLLDDPTETNEDGRTPLHMAAAGGSSSIIQLILSNSIVKSGLRSTEDLSTLDQGDNKRQTPLIIAASMGHVEATKLLLQYSADVSIQDDTGKTALHYAVLTCPAAVEDLASQNSAHIRDNDDCTALHIAARSGNARTTFAIVVALRQGSRFGEVVNSRDKANKTPLQYAAEYGYRAIVEEFLRYQEEVEEGNLRLAAQLSASCGQLSTVRSLISRTDVHTRSQLLVEASGAGQLLIVQYLLREKRISPDSEGQGLRPLCQASAKGHIEVVRALLRSRASVGIADEQRKTPLHHAAENGMYTVAKTLLFQDANVNAPDMNRETPLHSAAKSGNTSVIKLLLESKANVEACSRTKETPLHLAVTYPEAVNTLLKAGAEPNAVDSLKQTPLHMAARDKCLQSVQYLLQNKADVHARDDNGRLPLYYAIKEDDLSMVRELYQGHDDLKTNLSWAMDNSAGTVLDYLLQLGHKTKDEFDNVGVELLHVAAANESVEVLDVLLRSGVDVNVQFQGSSVLHSATVNGHVANIRKLLEYKATVDTIDDNRQTPLHLAAEANQTGVVEVLLQAGSDINALDEDSQTPVFIAAYHGSVESLKMLLQHKPDISITRNDGWAPLHAGADNLEVTRLLVGAGANPNMPKQDQWTPFHLAISWGDQFVAEYLLQHGGDPMLITEDSYTTLHLAVRANLREMAEALLESGAKDYINERAGIEKHTTLHIALDRPWVDPEMTRLLIEHGADVDLRTSKGLSTLELAVNARDPEILNLLLSRKITSRKDPDWKLDDLIPAYWRVITLHGQDVAEDETTPSTQYHNIIRTLVEKQKTLLNEESAEGGLNALEVCLSKRSKRRKEESLAILLVEQGINPLSRRHSHCESALQIGILSRELAKDDFLNLCVSKIPENATDAAALGLGFRELRIATELNQPNMWCKLEPLRDQVGNNTDTDGWSIDHFVHQASGRIPARVKVLPSTSSKTPQGMVFPSWWATNDQILGERFKIVDDGLGILFSLSRTNRVNLRADFPFPPRSIDPKNGDIQYFEVKILPADNIVEDFNHESETSPLPIIAIGFCGEFADMTNAMLGWNVWTVGYHGDNGMIFSNQDTLHGDHDTGRKFGQGNTVGCGIDYSNEEYFFTCDGEVVARHKDKVIFRKLYPAISHLDGSCKAEDWCWKAYLFEPKRIV